MFQEAPGEMREGPYDPRSICNLMLDEADRNETPITHLALQKLLYFAHALYLTRTKNPLVTGYFEAWQHGPVHPGAYKAFKAAGARPIVFRAERQNPLTGERSPLPKLSDRFVIQLVRDVMLSYGPMTPSRLRDISHAKGAPWDCVVSEGRQIPVFGLRISDDIIAAKFQHHKISVGRNEAEATGEPCEDRPFT